MKAILTGHSRGLGAALAERMLSSNMPVLALARTPHPTLGSRYPGLLREVALDLADTRELAAWLRTGELERYCEGDDPVCLINNAGIVQPIGALDAQDTAAIIQAVSLNIAAPLALSAAVATANAGRRETRILHISSGAGRNAYPGWSIYCATKAALDHHARAAALDARPGLRISSLAPGVIDTAMQGEIRASSLERFPLRERFDAMKREGALVSPEACAARVIDTLLDERFGASPIADLRDAGN